MMVLEHHDDNIAFYALTCVPTPSRSLVYSPNRSSTKSTKSSPNTTVLRRRNWTTSSTTTSNTAWAMSLGMARNKADAPSVLHSNSGRKRAVGACRDTRLGEHKGRMRIAHRPTGEARRTQSRTIIKIKGV